MIVVFVFLARSGIIKTVVHRPENKIIRSSERYQKRNLLPAPRIFKRAKSEDKKIGQILKRKF